MDKIRDSIVQALLGYLEKKPARKKTKKKVVSEEKKTDGISVSQTVNVGHPSPVNEADVALSHMTKKPDWSLLKGN